MNEFPNCETGEIAQALHERLGSIVQAAFLYGSVARGCRDAHDLDLLFVMTTNDPSAVFAAIADIQSRNSMLIHPTVVSPRELKSNPFLRDLVNSGTILWQNV